MTEFFTKSGAKVVIALAPWVDAKKLKAAIERQAAAAGVKFDKNADASCFISAILCVDSSEEVDAALYPCLSRCTRNGQKITMQTFDDADARQDYYEIVKACLTENFRPLVESLLSLLPEGLLKAMKNEGKPQITE